MKLKIALLAVILSCLITFGSAAKKPQEVSLENVGQNKLKMMKAKEASSSGGVIVMGASEFKNLVQQNPRPYDVVLLWNVVSGRTEHTTEVDSEYNQVVYSF